MLVIKQIFFCIVFLNFIAALPAQQTPFEKSNGNESATYFEAINFYKNLDKKSSCILMQKMGATDAGYPLHLVLISNDGKFDPRIWHKQHKVIILINNGIHPGEPDGIDASLMLARDFADKKIKLPDNVVVAIIPVYNIGGCLNRNRFSRVNQNGPVEYGFRGNAQNLDLNRDFTKCDSKNSISFTEIFHYLNPDILVDNHVSDGADYRHTMTLITTQYDKLGGDLGNWLKEIFEPALYKNMIKKGWDMIPYLEFENGNIDNGIQQFYDAPRYSSGYAALFHTLSFIPETHMLKPYKERVKSTYDLMESFIEESGIHAEAIISKRKQAIEEGKLKNDFALSWVCDTTKFTDITFKGYRQAFKTSEVTGLQSMYFNHNDTFTTQLKFYNVFKPANIISKPLAYIIPQGWWNVIELLKNNHVIIKALKNDITLEVETYHIDDYKSYPTAYEKHHKNYSVKVSSSIKKIKFLKGDYIISLNQEGNRYILETLEPTGDDSFFAWNFFDAILQQKEGYSDYRWEDVAEEYLKSHPEVKQKLDEKKRSDSVFAKNAAAQLNFVYKNSPYYEPEHLQYPVYRLLK